MIRYKYVLKDYRTWLNGLSKLLKIPVVKRKMVLDGEWGDGYIYAANINSDISYVIVNWTPRNDVCLFRKKSVEYGLNLFFTQTQVSNFFKISEQGEEVIGHHPIQNTIYLTSTNFDVEYTFSAGSQLRIVGIHFSPELLRKGVKKDILLNIQLYTGQGIHNFDREPMTFEYRSILDDIFNVDHNSPMSNLLLHNRIMLLAEKFLSDFLEKAMHWEKNPGGRKKEKEKDIHALKEVEEILSDEKLDKFPSIETLSRTAMMSSTKLKTKFKLVYGMKLYEFYNRSRLEKAKDMLQSGKYSVKETGHTIGFSNLSNFARAFKKEFGFLPNELLRNK